MQLAISLKSSCDLSSGRVVPWRRNAKISRAIISNDKNAARLGWLTSSSLNDGRWRGVELDDRFYLLRLRLIVSSALETE